MTVGRESLSLFGRAPERTVFGARLAAAIDGHGSFVLVEGEPGIGKTSLVRVLRAEAEQRQVGISLGGAAPFSDGRPLGLLSDALGIRFPGEDLRRAAVAELLREMSDASALHSGGVYALHDALLGLVEELAAERPQLIVLEDLHWADSATVKALWMLIRRVPRLPVLVVATTRRWPLSPELVSLRSRLDGAQQHLMSLGPLSDAARDELAVHMLGGPLGPQLRRRLAGANGNPFVLTTALHALREQGLVAGVGGELELFDPDANLTPHQPLVDRLVGLPERDVELLGRLALLGRASGVAELVAVTGRSAEDVLSSLDAGIRHGLLVDTGHGVVFRHDLVREAVIGCLEPAVRAHLHHEIGLALATYGAPASVVAAHLAIDATAGDSRTIHWLRRAAAEQERTNPSAAVALLEQAARLAVDEPTEVQLLADLARVLLLAHRGPEAEAAAQRALVLADTPGRRAELMVVLGEARALQGDAKGSLTYLEQAAMVKGLSPARRARVHADLSASRVLAGDVEGARAAAMTAIAEGGAAGLPALCAVGWSTLCRLHTIVGDNDDAIAAGQRALTLAESSGDPGHLPYHRLMAGMAFTSADRMDEGRVQLEAGCREAAAIGDMVGHLRCLSAMATHAFYEGVFDEVVEHADLAVAIGAELAAFRHHVAGEAMHGLVALHRDDLDTARRCLQRGLQALASRPSSHGVLHLAALQVRVALSSAESDEELRHGVAPLIELAGPMLDTTPAVMAWIAVDVLEAALLVGDDALARRVVETMEKQAVRSATASDRAVDLCCRGMYEGDLTLLRAAAEESLLSPRVLERARIHERAGRMAAAHRHDSTVSLLSDAARFWDQIGATRGVRLVGDFAQTNGIRLANRPGRGRSQSGWDSLTTAEREVLALVGHGLSNPAIAQRLVVSRRTVETHVSRLYAKLGIPNRVLLAAEAHRRGLRPAD